MAEEFKCVCGRKFKHASWLKAHQKHCKEYQESIGALPEGHEFKLDDVKFVKEKKEQMVQIYVRNEITIGRKKYCGQVYVPIKLARNLQSIDDKADKSNIHDTQFKKHMGDSGDVEVSIGGASRQLRPLR